MRTLPLGVLIVCGGTLAALPFRRYQPLDSPLIDPFKLTGPEQSVLLPLDFETTSLRADVLRLDDRDQHPGFSQVPDVPKDPALEQLRSMPRRLVRQSLEIPLTFEDLSQPIDDPGPVRDRWVTRQDQNAKAKGRVGNHSVGEQKAMGIVSNETFLGVAGRVAGNEQVSKPAVDSTQGDREETWAAEQVFDADEKSSSVTGRFISSPSTPSGDAADNQDSGSSSNLSPTWRALPERGRSDRMRQWIKQP